MQFILGANADIGNARKLQEDFIRAVEFGNDMLAIVADGTGATNDYLHPAVVAANSIINEFQDIINEDKDLFDQDPLFFLRRAMLNANSMIGMLKLADDQLYSGYAASVSAVYLTEGGKIHFAHAGDTRIYLLRNGVLNQMTEDHTEARRKQNEGLLLPGDDYYTSDDRLKVTNGIGMVSNPQIDTMEGSLKENDILLMTTDGVHYALTSDDMKTIILNAENEIDASEKLIYASKNLVEYPDNMAAIVIGVR